MAALSARVLLGVIVATLSFAPASAAPKTETPSKAPIVNFRLPTFTPTGFREWLVRGSEAFQVGGNNLDVTELTLTIFTGDASDRIETMILSPSAHIFPGTQVATGESTIRVINDSFEASGSDWRYSHKEKMISIKKNVHVTYKAELKNMLQ